MAITTTITPLEDDIINYSAQQQLQAAQQNALAGVDKSLAAGQVGYNNAVQDANAAYDNIARQAYANYQSGQKGLANQLASAGLYNTGYADTLRVQQANQYAANLNASEVERAKALRDLAAEQEANRLNAEAQKLDIQAQYGQLMANQANTDRDYSFALKQYGDSRADVEWEREQYLKEAQNAAQQQLISNAYNAAEIGDFSQLEALGIDTTAAKAAFAQSQRAALLDEAYAAAEMGDFSYLKALGVDTTGMEKMWQAELTRALYASYGGGGGSSSVGSGSGKVGDPKDYGISNSEYADAVARAERRTNELLNEGKSWAEVLAHAENIKTNMIKSFGEGYYKAYYDTVSSLYFNREADSGNNKLTVDLVHGEFVRNGINNRGDAIDAISGLSGSDYSIALQAVDKYFPEFTTTTGAQKYIQSAVKGSSTPITTAKSLLASMQGDGRVTPAMAAQIRRWIDNEMGR